MTDTVLRSIYTFLTNARAQLPDELLLLLLFTAAMLQVLLPPVPGDAVLSAAGVMSALSGPALAAQCLLCYWLGTASACILLYELGRAKGPALLRSRLLTRLLPERALARAGSILKRRGHWALLGAKFLPGVNWPTVLLAGASRAPRLRSYSAMAGASLLHNGALFLLGYAFGGSFWAVAAAMRSMSAVGLLLLAVGLGAAAWVYGCVLRRARRAQGGSDE